MNIIPHTGIIKKTWQRREKTIKRCRGFRVTFFTLPLPRRHSIPSRALDTKSGEKEQTVWLMSWAYTSQIFICFRFVSSAFELIKIRNRATNFNKFNECRRLDYSRSHSTFHSQEMSADLQTVLQQIQFLNVWVTSKFWKIIPQVAWCATGVSSLITRKQRNW